MICWEAAKKGGKTKKLRKSADFANSKFYSFTGRKYFFIYTRILIAKGKLLLQLLQEGIVQADGAPW